MCCDRDQQEWRHGRLSALGCHVRPDDRKVMAIAGQYIAIGQQDTMTGPDITHEDSKPPTLVNLR